MGAELAAAVHIILIQQLDEISFTRAAMPVGFTSVERYTNGGVRIDAVFKEFLFLMWSAHQKKSKAQFERRRTSDDRVGESDEHC